MSVLLFGGVVPLVEGVEGVPREEGVPQDERVTREALELLLIDAQLRLVSSVIIGPKPVSPSPMFRGWYFDDNMNSFFSSHINIQVK